MGMRREEGKREFESIVRKKGAGTEEARRSFFSLFKAIIHQSADEQKIKYRQSRRKK
jgi:hypothetical protein